MKIRKIKGIWLPSEHSEEALSLFFLSWRLGDLGQFAKGAFYACQDDHHARLAFHHRVDSCTPYDSYILRQGSRDQLPRPRDFFESDVVTTTTALQ
jgi:hypothetical protein